MFECPSFVALFWISSFYQFLNMVSTSKTHSCRSDKERQRETIFVRDRKSTSSVSIFKNFTSKKNRKNNIKHSHIGYSSSAFEKNIIYISFWHFYYSKHNRKITKMRLKHSEKNDTRTTLLMEYFAFNIYSK